MVVVFPLDLPEYCPNTCFSRSSAHLRAGGGDADFESPLDRDRGGFGDAFGGVMVATAPTETYVAKASRIRERTHVSESVSPSIGVAAAATPALDGFLSAYDAKMSESTDFAHSCDEASLEMLAELTPDPAFTRSFAAGPVGDTSVDESSSEKA